MFITDENHLVIRREIQLRERARQLRRDSTPAEQKLWQELRAQKLGVKFRRQHSLYRFIVDFYCRSLELVIEVDGPVHELLIQHDRDKDQYLILHGFTIMRFSNEDILYQLPEVLNKIKSYVNNNKALS